MTPSFAAVYNLSLLISSARPKTMVPPAPSTVLGTPGEPVSGEYVLTVLCAHAEPDPVRVVRV